jgi:hypothetical protein
MLRRPFPGALDLSEDTYDTGPLHRRAARWPLRPHPAARRTRWLWVVSLVAGFLAVLGWVLVHDPAPGLALSRLGWVKVALAALLAVLLGAHRAAGQLLRAVAEYVVVALLAVLLVTTASTQAAPAPPGRPVSRAGAAAKAADACPSIVHVRAWLACLWRAGQQASGPSDPSTPRRSHP